MIETALIIAAAASVLVLMTGTVVAFGVSLKSPPKLDDRVSEEQYREHLRRNYDQLHRLSDSGFYYRVPYRDL